MWKKIKDFFTQILYTIALPVAAAAIMWILAEMAALPAWEMFAAILFVIACSFWIVNYIETYLERHKKKISKYSDKELEATLRQWLDRRQYATQHKTGSGDPFFFVAIDAQQRPINVLKPKDDPTVIRLLLLIDEKEVIGIPVEQQIALRFRIGIEMARFGLLYHGEAPMYVQLDLTCDDLLTQSSFLSAIDKIRQAHVLMVAHIGATLEQAKTQTKDLLVKEQVPDKGGSQS